MTMKMNETAIKRIFVEKKKPFDIEAKALFDDIRGNLGIKSLEGLRVLNRYDIPGITDEEYNGARCTILSEPPVDMVYDQNLALENNEFPIAVEYLPGQYDQRADSAAQCIQIITRKQKPLICAARVIILKGKSISTDDITRIKEYLINPVDSREAKLEIPQTLQMNFTAPPDVETVKDFIYFSINRLEEFRSDQKLAMSLQDLEFCQSYFKNEEKRDPTITEIKVLDTYWSDHCRHTTFQAQLENIEFDDSPLMGPIKKAFEKYLEAYDLVYPDKAAKRDICLMNIATMSMKELKKKGILTDMEISGEVNACSIIREVDVDGKREEWLVMFKNETHNHPTEIEPFGGAATCLGGAIRDPLSGRAYVYQAMRVTGCANPLRKVEDTIPGKLPQRKITTEAAHGYSSYGNQIGVPTGMVWELYHDGYMAKRMEVGAVIGAVPRKNILREEPERGDAILLVGGRTGRDGIGGATGSSKEHTEDSIYTAGAEVQKGNAPEERKLQRLFRNREVCKIIKKSNDFGAGGVSVAVGELADGLEITLDNVPKKYEGLDGTELAISESQERMAVVISPVNLEKFKRLAGEENLEATEIATVTGDKRLKMTWRNRWIVNLKRDFIDTHGVRQKTDVHVSAPSESRADIFFLKTSQDVEKALKQNNLAEAWMENLKDLNTAGQQGLGERFDSSVGGGMVLMPFGGKYQRSPIEAMSAKIPVFSGDTATVSLMSYGFNPDLSSWSPFHGAVYSVVEAACRITAAGGNYQTTRATLQEYFEKLGNDKKRWGKPFSALLGAYHALTELQIPAIGGKDSMSGSFMNLDVPPTLITFAVDTTHACCVTSPEFKKPGSIVVYIPMPMDEQFLPCFDTLRKNLAHIRQWIEKGLILSAQTVRNGGIAAAISKMTFGNHIGFEFDPGFESQALFTPAYGSFLLEIDETCGGKIPGLFQGVEFKIMGRTVSEPVIRFADTGISIALQKALSAWQSTFEEVFPTHLSESKSNETIKRVPAIYTNRNTARPGQKFAQPRVLITVFPGTNCEYETQAAFERAGAVCETFVFRNLTPTDIEESLDMLKAKIQQSQVVVIPGGFSAGDEPEGSGKFIAAVFRNPWIKEAVTKLLKERDGLMLGICNGFQALIKLGLVPYGEIRDMDEGSPTLTFNQIGRHMNRMVRTKVVSVLSPWFIHHEVGEVHIIPSSHGEGRFIAPCEVMDGLMKKGQMATQYVDVDGNPTMDILFNPNGSMNAIEGITSPDGRILGKMAHTERISSYVAVNVPGNKNQRLFESGVSYFK